MQPIRVLIVDDSAVIRRRLSELLAGDPAITVAGTAGNGTLALARIADLKPDLVTLDIEMPGMSGIEALVEIRKLYPKLPVIMFSTLTGPGAAMTVEALARGASDYAAKPSADSPESAAEAIRRDLIPKIKALCGPPEAPEVQLSLLPLQSSPRRRGSQPGLIWWPSAPRPAVPTLWPLSCRNCRRIFRRQS